MKGSMGRIAKSREIPESLVEVWRGWIQEQRDWQSYQESDAPLLERLDRKRPGVTGHIPEHQWLALARYCFEDFSQMASQTRRDNLEFTGRAVVLGSLVSQAPDSLPAEDFAWLCDAVNAAKALHIDREFTAVAARYLQTHDKAPAAMRKLASRVSRGDKISNVGTAYRLFLWTDAGAPDPVPGCVSGILRADWKAMPAREHQTWKALFRHTCGAALFVGSNIGFAGRQPPCMTRDWPSTASAFLSHTQAGDRLERWFRAMQGRPALSTVGAHLAACLVGYALLLQHDAALRAAADRAAHLRAFLQTGSVAGRRLLLDYQSTLGLPPAEFDEVFTTTYSRHFNRF